MCESVEHLITFDARLFSFSFIDQDCVKAPCDGATFGVTMCRPNVYAIKGFGNVIASLGIRVPEFDFEENWNSVKRQPVTWRKQSNLMR